jgi:para-aminobenzoate synthetase/4-amino-4-deoxychorismate lyase
MAEKHTTASVDVPAVCGQPARRLLFHRPAAVWQVEDVSAVGDALRRVEAEQAEGRHVVGLLEYEAAPAFDAALVVRRRPGRLAWFAAFEASEVAELIHTPRATGSPRGRRPTARIHPRVPRAAYVAAVSRVLEHIAAGDVYQVSLTLRADVEFDGVPATWTSFDLFEWLRRRTPMPHAAFLDSGDSAVLSLSPELFLRRRGDVIESRPMKGTAARRRSAAADEAERAVLAADEKNRAENLMIVDLVRNDLGRVCRIGSVEAPELWTVESHPTVHQMTSLVRGRLRRGVGLFELLGGAFPAGSVTGAPKVRAMQVIAALEPEPRGAYCGALGVFFPGGDFELAVAIRTLEMEASSRSRGRWYGCLGLGAGIVADSVGESEWAEVLVKSRFLGRG